MFLAAVNSQLEDHEEEMLCCWWGKRVFHTVHTYAHHIHVRGSWGGFVSELINLEIRLEVLS